MSGLFVPVAFVVTGVVDRVEPPMAVVEWSGDRVADLPLDWLPAPVSEGDRLWLDLSADAAGPALATGPSALVPAPRPDARPVFVPGDGLVPGARYRFAAMQHDPAPTVPVEAPTPPAAR